MISSAEGENIYVTIILKQVTSWSMCSFLRKEATLKEEKMGLLQMSVLTYFHCFFQIIDNLAPWCSIREL